MMSISFLALIALPTVAVAPEFAMLAMLHLLPMPPLF